MSAERVFLVTGATGAVGSALVPLLLAAADTKVHVLLRATSDQALEARMRAMREYWKDRIDARATAGRLAAVRGDVAQERLGLREAEYAALAASVTNVVHAAGNVKLNQSLAAARASAVHPAEEVLRFVRACARSRALPKLEYVSTVGVAGRRPGLIGEEAQDGEQGYHNTYEQAKAEAERIVLREIAAGLPATIHRPSMVVGDSRDGRIIHFQVFYHLVPFLAGSRTRGVLPRFANVRLDLVPADYVAGAIAVSSARADATGRILHLCSGPSFAPPLTELGELLRQYLSAQGERTFAPRYVPRRLLRALIRAGRLVATQKARRALAALPFFLDYLDEAQAFANEGTRRFLEPSGLASRPVVEYLPTVLDYWYARQAQDAS